MSTLYVTEMGVQVHKSGERILVKRGNEILQDIPMIKLDRLVLMGKGINITTPTLYALVQRKVGVFYMTSRGKYMLRAVGSEHNHSQLRISQIRACDNPTISLAIARAIVRGKVHNQRVLVQRHSNGSSWATDALSRMDSYRLKIDSIQNMDELRGYEGAAAKDYFSLLRILLRKPSDGSEWGFHNRNYHPPKDPINALLSFGYTLLLNDLIAACQISGLDPDAGFFHAIGYNRPSMALDLEEEFRAIIVDSIVLKAINRPYFRLQDFEKQPSQQRRDDNEEEEEPSSMEMAPTSPKQEINSPVQAQAVYPVYLKENARKQFIELYESRINEKIFYPPISGHTSYRNIFEQQAYALSKVILGQSSQYIPFTIR